MRLPQFGRNKEEELKILKEKTSKLIRNSSKLISEAATLTNKTVKTVKESIPSTYAFLSVPELLKWSEELSKNIATVYDKALDSEYLKNHIKDVARLGQSQTLKNRKSLLL